MNIAFIPARCGSKSIPHKNVKIIFFHPPKNFFLPKSVPILSDCSFLGVLEFISLATSVITIRSKDTGHFLSMSRRGKVYGSVSF